jgi:lysophospholipase L1-like esterase
MKRILYLTALLFTITVGVSAQTQHRFWDDVQTIKKYDKLFVPQPHPIVFVGSSTIRKWAGLQVAFGKYNVINRGVGDTVIDDITYYLDDLVFAYNPRQIVLYVGENDLVAERETADTILNKTIVLYRAIRAKLPDVSIVYIGFKPSPSRDKYRDKCVKANQLIKDFLKSEKNTAFVDIFSLMLKDGKSRPELFLGDMLHMKPEGYAIWEKAVKPYLLKEGK